MTTKSNPIVVIDTNLFISAIIRGGIPFDLLKAWQQDKFILATSVQLLDEIEEVFSRDYIYNKYNLNQEQIMQLLDGIKLNALQVNPLRIENLPIHSRDLQDDKVLACFLGGEVNYLITGDEDLLILNGNPFLKDRVITSVRDFLKILNN